MNFINKNTSNTAHKKGTDLDETEATKVKF